MSEPWGSEEPEQEIPLQYRALFAESSPENGRVGAARVDALLARANVPSDAAALILESVASSGTVDEHDFYRALALAAIAQATPSDAAPGKDADAAAAVRTHLEHPDYKPLKLDAAPKTEPPEPVPEFNVTAPDTIRVTLMSELEGSFIFRHVIYTVDGSYQGKPIRVVRRYRDFVWLLDGLIKRFPFRLLPILPPKRLSVDGRYFSGDEAFLDRRRLGLIRFLNLLVKHPVVGHSELVRLFLTVDASIDVIKRQAADHTLPEFGDKRISPLFISQWDAASQQRRWRTIKSGVGEALAQTTTLCILLDRAITRHEAAASDARTLRLVADSLNEALPHAYPDLQDDLGTIRRGLGAAAEYAETRDGAERTAETQLQVQPLEQVKLYRDMLLAIRELFVRYAVHGGNTIASHERRIASTQARLAAKATKPDVSEDELAKLRGRIGDSQQAIRDQTNRDWLIKETMSRELEMAQATQYQVSQVLRTLATRVVADSEAVHDISTRFGDAVAELPLR